MTTVTSVSMTISTSRGPISGLWRPASVTRAAAVLLPDADTSTSDAASPLNSLLDALGARLQRSGVSAFQLSACPRDADVRQLCLLAALNTLRRQGVARIALIGCGVGASLAIAAGSASDEVTGVAAIAPDTTALEFVADLAPRRLLLLHGAADMVTSAGASRALYARAGDPKEVIIYPGERHDLIRCREEALDTLTTWTRDLLRNPFKPRCDHEALFSALASHVAPRDVALPGVR